MKFSTLVDKFEKLVSKHEQGSSIKSKKLSKLQQLLEDKKTRYLAKLDTTQDSEKRKKLETRLKVVNAQLEKSKQLLNTCSMEADISFLSRQKTATLFLHWKI